MTLHCGQFREDTDEIETLCEDDQRWYRIILIVDNARRDGRLDREEFLAAERIVVPHWPERVRYGVTTCSVCGDGVEWPCPPVRAVEEELGS